MATITERGGRYLVRVRRDGFKLVSKTFSRKQDAAAWARRVEADMESGRWTAQQAITPTLAEALALYRKSAATKLKGAAVYAYWFNELTASDIGGRRLSDITPAHLSAWRDAQTAGGLKPGSVVRKLGLLSGLLTWCHKERGWLTQNPMRSVSKPRVDDARSRTLTDTELQYLLDAARSSRATWLADVLVVLLRSAMRRGELWALNRADIDFDNAVAHVRETKNGSARDVPLCPQALAALRSLDAAATPEKLATLIPVAAPSAVSLAFRRTLVRARVAYAVDSANGRVAVRPDFLLDLRLHDLRHQAVTTWADTGALSMAELMAISGHKSPRMLARYTHLKATRLAVKMQFLSAGKADELHQPLPTP